MAKQSDVKLLITAQNATGKVIKGIQKSVKALSAELRGINADGDGKSVGVVDKINKSLNKLRKQVGPGGVMKALAGETKLATLAMKEANAAVEKSVADLAKDTTARAKNRAERLANLRLIRATKAELASERTFGKNQRITARKAKSVKNTARADQFTGFAERSDARVADFVRQIAALKKLDAEYKKAAISKERLATRETNIGIAKTNAGTAVADLNAVRTKAAETERSLGVLRKAFRTTFAGDLNKGRARFIELQNDIKEASEYTGKLGAAIKKTGYTMTEETLTMRANYEILIKKIKEMKAEQAGILRNRSQLASIVNNTGQGDIQDLDRRAGRAAALVKSDPNFNNSAAEASAGASRKAAEAKERFNRAQRISLMRGREQLGLFRRLRTSALAYGSVLIGFHAIGRGLGSIVDATKKIEAAQNRLRVVVGDNQTAIGQELDFVRRNAERLGIEFGMLAQEYTKFSIATKSTILEGANSRKIFLAVSEAARVNNASTEDLRGTYLALIQIISKGRITMEELKRQLGDRLPGAVHIMAAAIGVGTDELLKIVEAGDLSSDKLVEFADELDRRFGPGLEGALKSTQALIGKLQNSLFQSTLKLGQGGFIASFNDLLTTIQTTLASPEFATFLDRVSAGLAFLTNVVSLAIRNWRLLSVVMSGLIAIKLASVIKNLGGAMFVAAGQSVRLAQGMKFLKFAMNGAAGSALRLRAGLRALRILLFATGWGVAFAVIGALAAAFVSWKTAATDVNVALQNHKKIMDEVRNSWDEAAGDINKFLKALEKLSKFDVKRNKEATQGIYEEQKLVPTGIFASAKNENRPHFQGNISDIDKERARKIAEAEKKYAEFVAGVESGIIKDVDEEAKDLIDDLDVLFASFHDGEEIVEAVNVALRGTKGFVESFKAAVEGGAVFNAVNLGNPTDLLNQLAIAENLKLSIAELESKAAGQISKITNLGDPDLKAIDDVRGKLDELKKTSEELAQTQEALYIKMRRSGEAHRVAGLKAAHAATAWRALDTSLNYLNTTLARLEGFKGAADGLLGKAVNLAENLSVKDLPTEFGNASAAAKRLERSFEGFKHLSEPQQAILIRAELDGKSLEKIEEQINNNNFKGAQVSLLGQYQGSREEQVIGNKLSTAFGNGAIDNEEANFYAKKQARLDEITKSINQQITANQTLAKLEVLRNAGLEKRAFIMSQLAQFIGEDEEKRAFLLDPANYAELERLLDSFDGAFIPDKGKKGKTELEKLQEELAALIALREAREEQFGYQRSAVNEEAGGIASGRDEGLNKTRAEIAGLGDEIDLTAEKMLALLKGMKQTPEVRQMIAELELQMRDLGIEAGRIQESILAWEDGAPILENSFVSAFDALSESLAKNEKGFKSLTAAAVGFAVSLGRAIGDVLKQQAAEKIVKGIGNLFSFNSGTSGGIDIGALFRAKVKHGGGRVGSGGRSRMVSAAPLIQKLHNGGRAQGLAANEVMAVLERDEQVLTTDQQKDINGQLRGKGGSSTPRNVNVIIVSSEAEGLDAALSVPEGEEVILRHLNRMKKQVKGSLE